jgi:Phosphotransferase enzyme family
LPRSFPEAELGAALGAAPARWEPVVSGGYGSNTLHWRVELDDGSSVFVKDANDEDAAGWLRDEYRVYRSLEAPFLARFLAWYDRERTLLVLEDLSAAHWPPPWRRGDVDAVLARLEVVAATPAPPELPPLEDVRERLNGWNLVADDPRPLLSTGLVTQDWLEAALPALLDAGRACDLSGDALVHLDVRSDNLCFHEGRVVFVDWNLACVGNPLIDVVAWLPSLRLEGGPDPWHLVPESNGLAALIAGYFASRAGLPTPATAPRVRPFQRAQAEVALPWAARELGLPPPKLAL